MPRSFLKQRPISKLASNKWQRKHHEKWPLTNGSASIMKKYLAEAAPWGPEIAPIPYIYIYIFFFLVVYFNSIDDGKFTVFFAFRFLFKYRHGLNIFQRLNCHLPPVQHLRQGKKKLRYMRIYFWAWPLAL